MGSVKGLEADLSKGGWNDDAVFVDHNAIHGVQMLSDAVEYPDVWGHVK